MAAATVPGGVAVDQGGFAFPADVQGSEALLGFDLLGGNPLETLGVVRTDGLLALENASLYREIIERTASVFYGGRDGVLA